MFVQYVHHDSYPDRRQSDHVRWAIRATTKASEMPRIKGGPGMSWRGCEITGDPYPVRRSTAADFIGLKLEHERHVPSWLAAVYLADPDLRP